VVFPSQSWQFNEMKKSIPRDSSRYILYDGSEDEEAKIVFIIYNPDSNENARERQALSLKRK